MRVQLHGRLQVSSRLCQVLVLQVVAVEQREAELEIRIARVELQRSLLAGGARDGASELDRRELPRCRNAGGQ